MARYDLLKLHLFGCFALLGGTVLLVMVILTGFTLGFAGQVTRPGDVWQGLLSLLLGFCQASILMSFGLGFLQVREPVTDGHELRLHWTACFLGSLICTLCGLPLSQPLVVVGILTLIALWLIRDAIIGLSYP